jgi:pyruvate,water dikinase
MSMSMNPYVLELRDVDQSKFALVGGKGANLGELARMEGVQVPGGFCITTLAYREMVGEHPEIQARIAELSKLSVGEKDKIREISGGVRSAIERIVIDPGIVAEIDRCLSQLGDKYAYAVRSSATAEDLPTASFAGQQDTYLNVMGKEAIIQHISRCWASLFSERAVTYRIQNGFDHHKVELSVIVQRMVFPQASGIMFTADPVTSNRKVLSIDAGFGLGEALVSGLVNADIYKVRDGRIIEKNTAGRRRRRLKREDGMHLCWQRNRFCFSNERADTLKPVSVARKTSSGVWIAANFISCRAVRSPPCFPCLMWATRATGKPKFSSPSAIGR